jgi:hypothetical protein
MIATRGPGMICRTPSPIRTAASSHVPTGRPALGIMICAAEARALTLDCTVCVCRVGATAGRRFPLSGASWRAHK